MNKKDFYNILGVSKTATQDEIKKAYRKIALKNHPDKNPGDKKAEEAFKNATEAYSVLGDPEKRKEYDNPKTSANFNSGFDFSTDFGGMNVDDILNSFGFGRKKATQTKIVYQGSSRKIRLHVTLEEMYNGAEKTIKYKRKDKCDTCGGKGTTDETKTSKCPICGGTGKVFKANGFFQTMSTCTHCGGSGYIYTNPCTKCGGNGIVETETSLDITIPKGSAQGTQLTVHGYGDAPLKMNGKYGDFIIELMQEPHEKFDREGNDLITDIEIPVIDAILGCSATVETINGKKLSVKIAGGTEDGHRYKFNGYGMPIYGTNQYGNMIGVVKLQMPKQINDEEHKLLSQLKNMENFKV